MEEKFIPKSPTINKNIEKIPLYIKSTPININKKNKIKNNFSIKSIDNILIDNSNLIDTNTLLKKGSSLTYQINSAKTLTSLTDSHSIILIQSIFRGYLFRSKFNNVNNRNNIIYKRKISIQIELTNKKGIFWKSPKNESNTKAKLDLNNFPSIKKLMKKNHFFTKIIINNNNNALLKIILIQKFWKIYYNKKILEQKIESLFTDYRKNNFSISSSLPLISMSQDPCYKLFTSKKEKKKTFKTFKKNLFNKEDQENEERSINNYSSKNNIKTKIVDCKSRKIIKIRNRSLGMICNPCIISSDNSIIYKNRNSIKADRPIIFSKKHALNLNKTPDKNKVKINIGNNYDIKKITNYNLIWKKIEIKYNYKYDNNNFIFNNFKPNKNIVLVETNKNEKKLILNNKKNNIIIKPNINKLKKIKTKSKSKIKKIRIKNKSSENSNSSLSIKKTYTEKKIKIISFKQKIINKYNIKETKDNEPLLKLERKLIMEKPFK